MVYRSLLSALILLNHAMKIIRISINEVTEPAFDGQDIRGGQKNIP